MADITSQSMAQWGRVAPDVDLVPFALALRILRGGRLIEKLIDQAAADHGLTVSGDYELLAALRRLHPEPVQPAVLSGLMMISTSGVTGRLDRLESEGLVSRTSNLADRRAVNIVLSETGCEVAEAIFRSALGAFAAALSPMSKRDLKALSTALIEVLEALGDTPLQAGIAAAATG